MATPLSGCAPNSRHAGSAYSSYLITHRNTRYFRITVQNILRNLLGKREIRRLLDGMTSRSARTQALRLSVAAKTFFAFAEDMLAGRILVTQQKLSEHIENTSEMQIRLDTVWFDSVMKEQLSPA